MQFDIECVILDMVAETPKGAGNGYTKVLRFMTFVRR